MTDIDERLVWIAYECEEQCGPVRWSEACREAAKEIRRLRGEVETVLRREAETTTRHDAKLDTLEARLAKALKVMREIADSDDTDNALDPERNKRIARAFIVSLEGHSGD